MDVRVVCSQDVKKMLLRQARMVHWKRWAAEHKCEKLKDAAWLESVKALLRRETNDLWTDKHRNAM